MASASAAARKIILYDGVCGLCHRSVAWIMARDRHHRFHYAPLQGPTAEALRARFPEIPTTLSTVAVVDEATGRVALRTAAFLTILGDLVTPLAKLSVLRPIGWLFDPGYWLVTKWRYRLFGRFDACRAPTADERAQLLP